MLTFCVVSQTTKTLPLESFHRQDGEQETVNMVFVTYVNCCSFSK